MLATPPAILHLNAQPLSGNDTPIESSEVKLGAKRYPSDSPRVDLSPVRHQIAKSVVRPHGGRADAVTFKSRKLQEFFRTE